MGSTTKAFNPEEPVTKYLVHCYIYYILLDSVILDGEFDSLCMWMYKHYDELNSPYMHLVDRQAVHAWTGYHIPKDAYPEEIRNYAESLV